MTTIAATATVTALTPPIRLERALPVPSLRPAVEPRAAATPTATAQAVPGYVAARKSAQRFRGRRILAFVLSGFAGLGILSLGALAGQIAAATDPASLPVAEQRAVAILLRVAPFVMVLGFAQVMSAVAVVRDRARAMPLGFAMALLGAATAAVAIGALRVGGAAAVTGAASTPSTDLVNVLAWTLGLDILAALVIRRIVRGRADA